MLIIRVMMISVIMTVMMMINKIMIPMIMFKKNMIDKILITMRLASSCLARYGPYHLLV